MAGWDSGDSDSDSPPIYLPGLNDIDYDGNLYDDFHAFIIGDPDFEDFCDSDDDDDDFDYWFDDYEGDSDYSGHGPHYNDEDEDHNKFFISLQDSTVLTKLGFHKVGGGSVKALTMQLKSIN